MEIETKLNIFTSFGSKSKVVISIVKLVKEKCLAISNKKQEIIDFLYSTFKAEGFLCEYKALKLLSKNRFTFIEIYTLIGKFLSMGVIFSNDKQHGKDFIDNAQTDYAELYNNVVRLSPNSKPFIDYIRNTRPPQIKEWCVLLPQAKNGNSIAFYRLFEMYLRSVVRMAYNCYKKNKIDIDDAIQEGTIGLIGGLRKFDPTKHKNIASYLSYCIMQRFDRYVAKTGGLTSIPIHFLESIRKFDKKFKQFTLHNVNKPTDEELVNILDLSKEEIADIKQCKKKPLFLDAMPNQEIENLMQENNISSFSSPLGEDLNSLAITTINVLFNELSPKEKNILILHYGFDGAKKHTLNEIGEIYNVTRERIRQIEAEALNKLRDVLREKSFREWSSMNGLAYNDFKGNKE